MPPLNPEDYAPGRTIRSDGEQVRILDALVTGNGSRYLIASPDGSGFAALLPESVVRDNDDDTFEAVDPEDVTDAPDATDDSDTPPDAPNGDTPASPDAR